MKLFVVLLALRLIGAEKLNRKYLPPPGAKFSGGRSDDLQTPLEYPKEIQSYDASEYERIANAADKTENFKTEIPDEIAFSAMATKRPYYEYGSISHLKNGFDKPNESFGITYPGNMPVNTVSESIGNIGQNYQPNLFGMYGGKPMSIKYFDNNIKVAKDLKTSDEKIRNSQAEQYLLTTPRQNTGTVTTLGRNGQNLALKKFGKPQSNNDKSDIILNYENIQNPDGYYYNFDTSNGIHRDESAVTAKGVKAKGSYSYRGDDGKVYTVTYTADENGFQPSGEHLPPIPKAIQNIIEQAKRDQDAGIIDDGFYDETKYGHMKYQGAVHRYIQKNAETHKRKKIVGEKKILGPSKLKKYETNNNKIKSITTHYQIKQNKNRNPFGMRTIQVFDNIMNASHIESPETDENQNYTSDHIQKLYNKKVGPDNLVSKNFQNNRVTLNKEKTFAISATQDGYFYVPPGNVFVDGIYQDTNNHFESKSDSVTDNIDEYRNENYGFSNKNVSGPKLTQLITSTKKPLYQETYDNVLYVSSNADVDQTIDNMKTISKASSNKSDTEISEQVENIILSANPYDIKGTEEEEETAIPANRVETDFSSYQNDFNPANYQSTPPVSAETTYIMQNNGNTDQYETISSDFASTSSDFDYFENEGYFKTIPEKPTTFEDFPPSSTLTLDGLVTTEMIPSVKVDAFVMPDQELFAYFNDSTTDSFTNGIMSDTASKKSTPYSDDEETFGADKPTILDEKTITQFPNEFGLRLNKGDIKTPGDLYLGRDTIIGEDFSGPKQPQRYDPKNGYFY